MKKSHAEDLGHYWKTGRKHPDTILGDIKKMIESVGGTIHTEMVATVNGETAYILGFRVVDDDYRINQPVLPSRTDDLLSAKRQAVTALFHDIKAKVVSMKFRGVKAVFHEFLVLPDGRTASQVTAPEFSSSIKYLPVGGDE